jgi:hypothetical protein
LKNFAKAVGPMVSEKKTKAFLMCQNDLPHSLNYKSKFIKPREIIWYLGIAFGVKIYLADQWRWIMAKFEKKLQARDYLDFPLVGKITITDKILVARHIYRSPCLFPSQATYKWLEGILETFLSSKQGGQKGSLRWNWKGPRGVVVPKYQRAKDNSCWQMGNAHGGGEFSLESFGSSMDYADSTHLGYSRFFSVM